MSPVGGRQVSAPTGCWYKEVCMHEQFVEQLSRAVRGLKQEDPFMEEVNRGPLINESAAKKVRKGECV